MALPGDVRDRDFKAFKENATDGGIDRRVHDVDANASLNGIGGMLNGVKYDAFSVAYPTAVQEVYSFYSGGLAGTLVATITIVYDTASKNDILTAVKV